MFDKKQLEKQPHSWSSHLNTTTRFLLSLPVKQLPKRAKRWTLSGYDYSSTARFILSFMLDWPTDSWRLPQVTNIFSPFVLLGGRECWLYTRLSPGWLMRRIDWCSKIRILNIFIISNPIHIYILTFPLNDILIDSGGIHISCAILRLDYAVLGPLWEI